MTDRGLPSADGSSACPFVAFEDDRDERADRPDHRHRCYAEIEPAPRALAHQEAYCLSSAFPVCPTFQEWARREAARARAGGEAVKAPPAAALATSSPPEAAPTAADTDEAWVTDRDIPIEERPRRNPPRDWAAPPPWAGGAVDGGARRGADEGPPDFLAERSEGRGLAGSAADRLASGEDLVGPPADPADPLRPVVRPRPGPDSPAAPPDAELAGLVRPPASHRPSFDRAGIPGDDDRDEGYPPTTRGGRRPAVSSTRDRDRDRERERERAAERSARNDGPAWERQRRSEAYPTIKTRAGLPSMAGLPRAAILFGALVFAAVALFFLPALLGVGGRDAPIGSPSPTVAVPTATLEPTPIPAPTPQVYVIKAGDNLSRIARAFGLTLDQLLEANKDKITNPNLIAVGDEIIIPVPPPDEVGTEPSASP